MLTVILGTSINNTIGFNSSISLVLNPIIQEAGRFILFLLIYAVDTSFSQHIRENRTSASLKESISESQTCSMNSAGKEQTIINFLNAAFFSGVGFAFGQITNHLLLFITQLSGPGSPFYDDPQDDYFVLLTSVLATLRAIDNISWNIIMFQGIDKKTWFGPVVVIIFHCTITYITSYIRINETAGKCILIVVSFMTSSCTVWAYRIAGGKFFQPPCLKELNHTKKSSKSSEESFSSPKERKESLDVILKEIKRASMTRPPLLKKVELENKKTSTNNENLKNTLQNTQHVSFQ